MKKITHMYDNENSTYETERAGENKSTLLLVIAIVLAAAVTIWIVLSFDKESGPPDPIGQQKIKQIMVANLSDSGNNIL